MSNPKSSLWAEAKEKSLKDRMGTSGKTAAWLKAKEKSHKDRIAIKGKVARWLERKDEAGADLTARIKPKKAASSGKNKKNNT